MNDMVVFASTQFLKIVMQMTKEFQEVTKSEEEFYITKKVNTWEQL